MNDICNLRQPQSRNAKRQVLLHDQPDCFSIHAHGVAGRIRSLAGYPSGGGVNKHWLLTINS
jgi:hypothetical protein